MKYCPKCRDRIQSEQFCGNCGSSCHDALQVAVNPGNTLHPQCPGALTVELINVSPLELHITAVLQGRIPLVEGGEWLSSCNLSPDDCTTLTPEFHVPSEGSHVLRLYLEDRQSCAETMKSFVLEVSPQFNVANISIVNNSKNFVGDNNVHVNSPEQRSPMRDNQATSVRMEQSSGRLHPVAQAERVSLSKLAIEWQEVSGPRTACLVAQSTVVLGRGSASCVQLNDDRQVSRRHLEIVFIEAGPHWRSLSDNGVDFLSENEGDVGEGKNKPVWKRIQAPGPHPFRDGVSLSLAGILPLHSRVFPLKKAAKDLPRKYRQFVSKCAGHLPDQLGIYAVRLTRANPREFYLLMQHEVLLGGHEQTACHICHPALQASHARILHLADEFWIQPFSARCVVKVDGRELAPWELGQLRPGVVLEFGRTDPLQINVLDFYQPLVRKDPGVYEN